MSVEPRFEQTAIRTDLGAIFVSLELLCSNASGMAMTVHPANHGWSCKV